MFTTMKHYGTNELTRIIKISQKLAHSLMTIIILIINHQEKARTRHRKNAEPLLSEMTRGKKIVYRFPT